MLRCVSPYKTQDVSYKPGDEINDARLEAHLLNDSPASFEVVEVEAKAVDVAPVDKMVKGAKTKAAVDG